MVMDRIREQMLQGAAQAADQQPWRCAKCNEPVSHIRRNDCACTRALKEKPMSPSFREQLDAAHKLPSEELKRHAAVAKLEGQVRDSTDNGKRCRECFCCAAEVVLWQREAARYGAQGKYSTPTCTFPAPPVTTVSWDDAAWDVYLLNHCPCAHHVAMRAEQGTQRKDILGRPVGP